MIGKLGALVVGMLVIAGTGRASAATITYDYTGNVYTASNTAIWGDHINAVVSFNCNPCADGTYNLLNDALVTGLQLSAGPYSSPASAFTFASLTLFGGAVTNWNINATESPSAYTGDTAFLTTSPVFDEACNFFCGLFGNNLRNPGGNWTSVVSATPLPAALPLFASGLGALGMLGWRRKRKALTA
jgi:hypothetical protein